MNREAIYSALFSLASSSASFVTKSRRMKLWSSVPPADKPALFMLERGEHYTHASEALPEAVMLHVDFYIYTDAGQDQSATPATSLNTLLDALDMAFKPDALSGRQTLGGLVSHCWIEGRVLKDPGDLDGSGLAVVPVKILVPR